MPRVKVKTTRWTRSYLGCDLEKDRICYSTDHCKYWKRCHEERGTVFSHGWGKKMLMLLEMKRPTPKPSKPRKDKELDQFFTSSRKGEGNGW